MTTTSQTDIGTIILAAGKGTRMKSTDVNKVSLEFHGKPIISYAVEIAQDVSDHVVVVIGAMSDSVKKALSNYSVEFAVQKEQLGTGHAAQVGFDVLKKHNPKYVLVGYGDHMMFYKPERLRDLIAFHEKKGADISLVTTKHENPNSLAWSRILRDNKGDVIGIAEQKDATEEQRKVKEINPGFYCMNHEFLEEFLPKITKSAVTQEYYLTELLELASKSGKKIAAMPVPFEEVGIGINKSEELQESQELFKKVNK